MLFLPDWTPAGSGGNGGHAHRNRGAPGLASVAAADNSADEQDNENNQENTHCLVLSNWVFLLCLTIHSHIPVVSLEL